MSCGLKKKVGCHCKLIPQPGSNPEASFALINIIPKFAFLKKFMNRRHLLYFLSGSGLITLFVLFLLFRHLCGIDFPGGKTTVIYIPSGSSYSQVIDTLKADLSVKSWKFLNWVAKKKKYPNHIKPGKYIIDKDMSIIGLIDMLRSGRQSPVNVTFNNIRTIYQLAGKIGGQIEADSSQIVAFLSDKENFSNDGFTSQDIISVFIPDTYQFFWNTGAGGLYKRMVKEYRKFWNEERIKKAKAENLTPAEVSILASIIDDEVAKAEEKPRIAGVYLNRLRQGIPLQACPTIKFALNDFTITRVLNKHLQVDSPYNTYKHRGFPPGPIGCPTIEGIDAVLNAEKHKFLYFAAKADFSGYHNFSRTLAEHNRFAAEYQRELDKLKIFK